MKTAWLRLQLSAAPVTNRLNARPSSSSRSTEVVNTSGLLLQQRTSRGSRSLASPMSLPSGKETEMGRCDASGGSRRDSSRLSYPSLTRNTVDVLATPRGTCNSRGQQHWETASLCLVGGCQDTTPVERHPLTENDDTDTGLQLATQYTGACTPGCRLHFGVHSAVNPITASSNPC